MSSPIHVLAQTFCLAYAWLEIKISKRRAGGGETFRPKNVRRNGLTLPPPSSFRCGKLNARLPADGHMDAASVEFVEHFLEEGRRPEWFVTSPPYRNALTFVKNACRIATVGVAFKLRLSFLEPVVSRAQWLTENPPSTVVVLSRAMYRGRQSSGVEAWFVWKVQQETQSGASLCFAPTA